ncbi:protein DEK isoform X2 [Thalassophryne amazonica]|uniref:protein DEK isoform X2 n=1 Tax=Thalassophryne amazonica TaxID=390379 RepID=UPI001471C886|nr:protein DEK isoform X2 [Thalassophryne amazonica]
MSAIADEAMDSSAVSEEEVEEQCQEEQSSPSQSYNKVSAVGEIIEGKRAKKAVERLDIQVKQKEKFKVEDGGGDKLGDIPRTNYLLTKIKPADLKPLHTILFDRPGKVSMIKKNVRLFNGFPFDMDSEQYNRKREKLLKNSHFTNTKLKVICGVLDLEKKGTHSDLIDRILTFLISPKNSGKRLPTKKKRRSKKKLSGDDAVSKTKRKGRPKPRNTSSPKKSKAGSKSKAIVMDSSSDEDEEDDKAGASAGAEGSDNEEKLSEKDEMSEQSEDEQSEEEEEEEGDEDEGPKTKMGRVKPATSKSAPAKRQRTPAKKNGPPKKRAKKEPSGQSEADSGADEKPKTKKSAAKAKRADSSSNRKNNTNTADDSSDDEPLIKMIKKAPSEEELKETVQGLLKEANLEEMTMKQICRKVFDTYPDYDLTSKKDFIKNTVKSLIT